MSFFVPFIFNCFFYKVFLEQEPFQVALVDVVLNLLFELQVIFGVMSILTVEETV